MSKNKIIVLEGERDRETERERDRQTDIQTGRQAGRKRQRDIETDKSQQRDGGGGGGEEETGNGNKMTALRFQERDVRWEGWGGGASDTPGLPSGGVALIHCICKENTASSWVQPLICRPRFRQTAKSDTMTSLSVFYQRKAVDGVRLRDCPVGYLRSPLCPVPQNRSQGTRGCKEHTNSSLNPFAA